MIVQVYRNIIRPFKCEELLISKGADINAKDMYDQTSFHHATENDLTKMGKILISAGADINAEDNDGETPLAIARQWEKQKME